MHRTYNLYNRKRGPIEPGCGLIEDDDSPIQDTLHTNNDCHYDMPFPLDIFSEGVRNIIIALEEYENFNLDFTAASFLTVFAAAMGNKWSVRFMTGWVNRPIIFMVLVGSPSCGKTPPLQQAVAPLLKIDGEYDRIYCKEMETYRKWERMSSKQREKHSLPEDMTVPKRKCHVVVDSTLEALIGALRDNQRGVLMYKDEIDSLLSNFNRYNGSDEAYFLSLFNGTAFKYSRKSSNEHIFLPNPYCSLIGTSQPGSLASQFGGKRMINGFSSRFLKVYPEINEMPMWNDNDMPEDVLTQWEAIIRKVIDIPITTDKEGNVISTELSFSPEAKQRIRRWKNEINNAAYSATESDTVRALCGKLEIYVIRFCLVIQIMRGICDGASMENIDIESAERAIMLTEYFRSMETRISPELEIGILEPRYVELLGRVGDSFKTAEILREAQKLGISRAKLFRFLKDGSKGFISKDAHGRYYKNTNPK